MHQDFIVVDIATDLFNKKIDIYFNFELDASTVTDRSLKIVDNTSGSVIPITYEVDGSCISVTLKEDPVPETEYMLICNKEICNVTKQKLKTEYVRYIRFTSTIKNKIKIVSPNNLETIDKLYVVWQEIKDEPNPFISRYRIQIAKDNNFSNIVIDTIINDKNDVYLTPEDPDKYQYYLRIRVESDNEFGAWSDIVSFVYDKDLNKKSDDDNSTSSKEDIKPVVDIPLTLVDKPENGDTPESFIFTFDDPIDASSLNINMIHVTRKDW